MRVSAAGTWYERDRSGSSSCGLRTAAEGGFYVPRRSNSGHTVLTGWPQGVAERPQGRGADAIAPTLSSDDLPGGALADSEAVFITPVSCISLSKLSGIGLAQEAFERRTP